MKNIFTVLFFFLLSAATLSAEKKEFHLKDDSVIKGEVIEEMPGKYYIIETDNGSRIKVNTDSIEKIIAIGKIFDNEYPELGLSFIMPAGINLNLGYTFEDFGLMLTPGVFGVELAGAFKLGHQKTLSNEIVIPMGFMNFEYEEFVYTGAIYKFWAYGFQFMGGLILGSGDFSNPQVYLQLGYVYRFN